jgi:hypothetical protein
VAEKVVEGLLLNTSGLGLSQLLEIVVVVYYLTTLPIAKRSVAKEGEGRDETPKNFLTQNAGEREREVLLTITK